MKTTKRFFALLLTLVMALSMMTMIADAEENEANNEAAYAPEDVYVLNYGGTGSGYPFLYFSPYSSYAT